MNKLSHEDRNAEQETFHNHKFFSLNIQGLISDN